VSDGGVGLAEGDPGLEVGRLGRANLQGQALAMGCLIYHLDHTLGDSNKTIGAIGVFDVGQCGQAILRQ